MENKLLLEEFNPLLSSYWFWSNQLLIIREIKNNDRWLCNNFINLRCLINSPHSIYFYNEDYRNKMVEYYNCPFIDFQKINFESKKKVYGMDIIPFIEQSIENKTYVLIMIERLYVSSYNFKESNFHQILIHGYDDQLKEFYFSDNIKSGKFQSNLSASYEEMYKAINDFTSFESEPDFNTGFFLLEPKENDDYKLDLMKIKRSIRHYLDPHLYSDENWAYGVDVYRYLTHSLSYSLSSRKFDKDIKGISALYDHKKAMLYRINKLANEKILDPQYVSQFKEIESKCRMLLMLYLKFTNTEDLVILDRCYSYVQNIQEEEIPILNNIVGAL